MPSRLALLSGGSIVVAASMLPAAAEAANMTVAVSAAGALATIMDLISTTYARAPALVLGLAVLLALPPLTLVGIALRRAPVRDTSSDATRVYRRGGRGRLKEIDDLTESGPLWPSDAWIEGPNGLRHDIGSGILRLGRDADNDICLEDKTVHRYHAAIHRTDDAAYVITDLSSAGGNGVLVNGQRTTEAQLNDGDTVELGQIKLKFVSRPT